MIVPGAIYWCELCSERPSDGVLEVLPVDEIEKSYMQVCLDCVNRLDADDWINNAKL